MSDLKIYAQNLESAAMEQIETLASAPAQARDSLKATLGVPL